MVWRRRDWVLIVCITIECLGHGAVQIMVFDEYEAERVFKIVRSCKFAILEIGENGLRIRPEKMPMTMKEC